MKKNQNDVLKLLFWTAIFIALFAILVYIFFNLDYPNGKSPSIADLVIFFFRELIFVGFLLITVPILIAAKLFTIFKSKKTKNTDSEQRAN